MVLMISLLRFFETVQRPLDIKNRPRIPIPDEDPYSEAAGSASSSGSSGLGGSGSAGEGNGSRDIGSVVAATREQLLIQSQGLKRSEKPPKLPPRDNLYPGALKVSVKLQTAWNRSNDNLNLPQPDYDDIEDETHVPNKPRGKSDKGKEHKKFGEFKSPPNLPPISNLRFSFHQTIRIIVVYALECQTLSLRPTRRQMAPSPRRK
jgi:hypothetical protein